MDVPSGREKTNEKKLVFVALFHGRARPAAARLT